MIILFLLFNQVKASKWVKLSPTIKLNFNINFIYDDNVFKYSAKDIDDFLNNRKPARFSNVESHNDFITNGNLRLRIKKWNTEFYFNYSIYWYAVNNIKNYQVIKFEIKRPRYSLGYILVPQFHIRDYYDNDFRKYVRCDFLEHKIFFDVNVRAIRKLPIQLIYNFVYYDYNSYFDEYDTKSNVLGIKLSKNTKLSIKYMYEIAKSVWRDKPKAPDLSYNQHYVSLFLSYFIKIGYGYEYRIYTSKKSIQEDPVHRDRIDGIHNFSIGINKKITKKLTAEIKYEYEKRNTSSPKKEVIDEVKDYKKNRIYVGISLL